jgi:hypothetical protein
MNFWSGQNKSSSGHRDAEKKLQPVCAAWQSKGASVSMLNKFTTHLETSHVGAVVLQLLVAPTGTYESILDIQLTQKTEAAHVLSSRHFSARRGMSVAFFFSVRLCSMGLDNLWSYI